MAVYSLLRLLFFFIFFIIFVDGQCLDGQKKLLLDLRSEFEYNSSIPPSFVDWNETADCCGWLGIECDDIGRVTSLSLYSEGVSGEISESSLFRLANLSKLDLSNNDFSKSEIPNQFHRLPNLANLDLSNSGFMGPIPSTLANLTELVELDLSSNFLTGFSPTSGLDLVIGGFFWGYVVVHSVKLRFLFPEYISTGSHFVTCGRIVWGGPWPSAVTVVLNRIKLEESSLVEGLTRLLVVLSGLMKMKCVLIRQKVFNSVEGNVPDSEPEDKAAEMNELARSTIILNFSDSVIRKVGTIESAFELWEKLDKPQYIKRYGDKTIDGYTSIALMNAIPDSYNDVKAAIKYGRDSAPLI
ncbi:receptor like protein 27-like [Salvia hispanica]|uniref:receptor like protein 27-like n=1 Tax=Salvia hispanica TaxID=49212 RepID=UPI0020099AF9|nr:receptor like protein 27-like [Salvia hispanica]